MLSRFILLLALFCAACESPTDEPTIITGSINIFPDPMPALRLGLPFQMVVAATGPDTAVTWSSSNTDIVRVDSRGVVTGVSIGSAFISAWLTFDPTIRDSVVVSTNAGMILPLIIVQINGITDSTGTVVDTTAVRGSVIVTFVTDIPANVVAEGVEARLELRNSDICRIKLAATPHSHTCTIDTTRFGKGPASLVVKIVRTSDGLLLANSATRTLELVQ